MFGARGAHPMRKRICTSAGLLTATLCVLLAGAAEDPPRRHSRPHRGREWRVLSLGMLKRSDAVGLAQSLLGDISEQQKERLKVLRANQAEEAAQFEARLAEKYSGRVARELTIPQRATFESAEKVLDELREVIRLQGEKLIRIAGPEARKRVNSATGRVDTSDLLVYIGLDAEVHAQLRKLQREMDSSIGEAMRAFVKDTAAKTPKLKSNKVYVEHYRELRAKLRARYVVERDSLLTPKQIEKLHEIDAAVQAYDKAIGLAYNAAAAGLRKLME
jgi:hypothetical protein